MESASARKKACFWGTGILLTPATVYLNCFVILIKGFKSARVLAISLIAICYGKLVPHQQSSNAFETFRIFSLT